MKVCVPGTCQEEQRGGAGGPSKTSWTPENNISVQLQRNILNKCMYKVEYRVAIKNYVPMKILFYESMFKI